MAAEDNFIVAIELSSSKVVGLAGRKQPDGAIQILAYAQEPASSFIRKGRIFNVEKMKQCISNMKQNLEKDLNKYINQVYVGIGGMGMHSVIHNISRSFSDKVIISQEIIDEMKDTNFNTSSTYKEILDVIPQEYKLGTQYQTDPVGVFSDNIEGCFLNIVANPNMCEQVDNCFRAAGVSIADKPITIINLADSILTDSEKRTGCVFVDMGAETTSVAIYKNNILRHLAVIPLGGANVTRDITNFIIDEEEAENLKQQYGVAYTENYTKQAAIQLKDGRAIEHEEFTELVEARMEEIILNIANQIKLSKIEAEKLIGGIILTGGAANMKDIEKAVSKYTDFEKVRVVKSLRLSLRANASDFNRDGSYNAALALIEHGDINCCGGNLGSSSNTLFPTVEEIKAQQEAEERARREKEEQERLKAEEEKRLQEELEAEKEAQRIKEEQEKERKKKFWNPFKSMINKMTSLVNEEGENTDSSEQTRND